MLEVKNLLLLFILKNLLLSCTIFVSDLLIIVSLVVSIVSGEKSISFLCSFDEFVLRYQSVSYYQINKEK